MSKQTKEYLNHLKLIQAYEDYISLISEELQELASNMFVKGWSSTRVEKGEKMRELIKSLKNAS